jgi:hypothetical protein
VRAILRMPARLLAAALSLLALSTINTWLPFELDPAQERGDASNRSLLGFRGVDSSSGAESTRRIGHDWRSRIRSSLPLSAV